MLEAQALQEKQRNRSRRRLPCEVRVTYRLGKERCVFPLARIEPISSLRKERVSPSQGGRRASRTWPGADHGMSF